MSDFTLQIVLNPSNHSLPLEKIGGRYLFGDLVGIYPLVVEPPSPNSRLGFIHVLNVPDGMTTEGLRAELIRPEMLTVNAGTNKEDIITQSRSVWAINIPSVIDVEQLKTDREVTVDWDVIAPLFTRKYDGVTGIQVYQAWAAQNG